MIRMATPRIAAVVDISGAEDRVLETLESVAVQRDTTVRVSTFGGKSATGFVFRWGALHNGQMVHHPTVHAAVRDSDADYIVLLSGGELLGTDAGSTVQAAAESGADVVMGDQVVFRPDGLSAIGAYHETSAQGQISRAVFVRRELLIDIFDSPTPPSEVDEIVARAVASADEVEMVPEALVVQRYEGAGGDADYTSVILNALHAHLNGARTVPLDEIGARVSRWSRGAPTLAEVADVGSALRSILDRFSRRQYPKLDAVCDLLEHSDLDGARVLLNTERVPSRGPAARMRAVASRVRCDSGSIDVENEAVSVLRSALLLDVEDARAWNELADAFAAIRPERIHEVVGLGNAEQRLLRRMTVKAVEAEGNVLRLSVAADGAHALPVLYDARGGRVLRPNETSTVNLSGQITVCFVVSDLPFGDALTVAAIGAPGTVTGVPFRGTVPLYKPRRSLLIDDQDGVLTIIRRRHWVLRAPRSAFRRLSRRRFR